MRNAINFLLAATAVMLSLLAIEFATRIIVDNGMQYDIEMWKYARQLKRPAANALQGHEHIPNRSAHLMGVDVSINSFGLRNREIALEKPPGTARVLMLGDSVTLGWGVRSEETTASHLEKLLNQQGGKAFEVINTGVGNTNTEMQVAYFLNQGIAFSPDIVILNYFINDAEPTPRRRSNLALEHFYAYVYLSGRVDSLTRRYLGGKTWRDYYLDLYADDAEGWKHARNALRQLAEYCRAHSIKLMMTNYPELHTVRDYPFLAVNQKLAATAAELDLPYLDLLPAVSGEREESLWVSAGDQHPNGYADSLFAGAIMTALAIK